MWRDFYFRNMNAALAILSILILINLVVGVAIWKGGSDVVKAFCVFNFFVALYGILIISGLVWTL